MYTLRTKDIDGYKVITGFDRKLIDPEATRKKIEGLIEDTSEYAAIEAKTKEIKPLNQRWIDLKKAVKEAKENKNEGLLAKHSFEMGQIEGKLDIHLRSWEELKVALKEKLQSIRADNIVYFEPREGEIGISEEQYFILREKLSTLKNAVLTADGKEIIDCRGVKYIKNGKICVVESLGEEPDGPLMDDITPDQYEAMRMESLTKDEKEKEYNSIIEGLASQAAMMRSKLEIQGASDALEQAQEWYTEQVADLDSKYGIIKEK